MKSTKKHLSLARTYTKSAVLIGITIVSIVGVSILDFTKAATIDNPVGYADSCSFVGGKTVIYGWVHDNNAPAGSQPNITINVTGAGSQTVTSNLDYREASVDSYLVTRGYTASSTYGFSVSYTGLYKGGSHTITGTIINVGTGANQALTINTSVTGFGNIFINSKIPDNCMASIPAPPPPAPNPTPTPTPSPSPTPAPAPAPKPAAKPSPSPSPAPTPSPSTSPATTTLDVASAIIATTPSSADFTISSPGAKTVKIAYGTSENKLDSSGSDVIVSDNSAKISLRNLKALQTYYYQLISTGADGKTIAAATKSFKTKGFALTVTFNGQNIQGIPVSIAALDKSGKTDKDGKVTLSELPTGTYTLSYTYNNSTVEKSIEVSSSASSTRTSQNIPLVIDLKTAAVQVTPTNNTNPAGIIVGIVLFVIIGSAIVWFVVRRRRQPSYANGYTDLPPPLPAPTHSQPNINNSKPRQETALHIGKSLSQMVIEAMQEDARKNRDNNKQP